MKIITSFEELYSLLAKPFLHYAFNHPDGIRDTGSTQYLVDLTGNSEDVRLWNVIVDTPNNIADRKGRFNGSTSYAATKVILPERYYIDTEIMPLTGNTGCIMGTAIYGNNTAISSQADGMVLTVSGNSSSTMANHFNCNGNSYMNNFGTGAIPLSERARIEYIYSNVIDSPVLRKTSKQSIAYSNPCNAVVKQVRALCLGRCQPLASQLSYNGFLYYLKIYDLDKLIQTKMFLQDDDGKYYTLDATNRIVVIPEDMYITDEKLLNAIKDSGFTTSQLTNLPQALVNGWFKEKFRIVAQIV